MWGIVVYDKNTGTFIAGRDHVGIIPLYIGSAKDGTKFVSSELKVIYDVCEKMEILLPGHYITNDWVQKPWYKPKWHDLDYIPNTPLDLKDLNANLTRAVQE
jgi:asparagine synthase (glutamine-hydrolysing)